MIPIRVFPNEEFREIIIEDKLKLRYAISNKGRLISFVNDIKFGRELKGGTSDGYKTFNYNFPKFFVWKNSNWHHWFKFHFNLNFIFYDFSAFRKTDAQRSGALHSCELRN